MRNPPKHRRPPRLQPGDILTLRLLRVPIYEHHGHVPAYKETTKQFRVRDVGQYGYSLAPVRKEKKVRGWMLSMSLETLNSFTKPPLKYEVLSVVVENRD